MTVDRVSLIFLVFPNSTAFFKFLSSIYTNNYTCVHGWIVIGLCDSLCSATATISYPASLSNPPNGCCTM
jgi:hypothetical protein